MRAQAPVIAPNPEEPRSRLSTLFLNIFIIAVLSSLTCLAPFLGTYRYGLYDAFNAWRRDEAASTTWAPDFTESAFSHVSLDMSEAEVLRLLGPPIYAKEGLWRYSAKNGTRYGFHLRAIRFEAGRVIEIHRVYRVLRW